jgi:HAMP domain-containing protein
MGLRLKFNLVLIAVFAVGIASSGWISRRILDRNAQDEVERNAGLMMESAMAVRDYTVGQVKPNLELQLMRVFLPQSVPAYAATEVFNNLRKKYPEYSYKEATLNPTNPRDKTVEWEADLVTQFRNNPEVKETGGVRDTPNGPSLYRARPIIISNAEKCLPCHDTVARAPASMIQMYGPANGFGWKHNEIVGAQIISVPMSVPLARADAAFKTFLISLAFVFVLAFIVLNITLSVMVIRPIVRMSKAADEISVGNLQIPEFAVNSKDEIGVLATSFNRLRRSLEKAMKLLE